jgi:hypothetical protein
MFQVSDDTYHGDSKWGHNTYFRKPIAPFPSPVRPEIEKPEEGRKMGTQYFIPEKGFVRRDRGGEISIVSPIKMSVSGQRFDRERTGIPRPDGPALRETGGVNVACALLV